MAEAQALPQQTDDGAVHLADEPPYPTFTELRIAGERVPPFSEAFERLIWPISGEFPSAIAVRDGAQVVPLFDSARREWHSIAMLPITTRKVSGLEASLQNLDAYDHLWERQHEDHPQGEHVTYGDLHNDVRPFAREPEREDGTWSWDEPSDREILVRCCGEDRPLEMTGLTLEVRASHDFVTVKDYVGAVHPWLMSMRDDIVAAMRLAEPGYPEDTEWRLSTDCFDAPAHTIMLPEEWNGSIVRGPTPTAAENDAIMRRLFPHLAALPPGAELRLTMHDALTKD